MMSSESVFLALILGVGMLWMRAPFLSDAIAMIPAMTPGVGVAVVDPPVAAAVAFLLSQNSLAKSPPLNDDD